MARKKTTEEFKAQLKEIAPDITVLGEYKTNKEKILVLDTKCGHERSISPNLILSERGSGKVCRVCIPQVIHNKKGPEKFEQQLKEIAPHLTLLEKYIGNKTNLLVSCDNNHTWKISPTHALAKGNYGVICRVCTPHLAHNKLSQEEFKTKLNLVNSDLEVLGAYVGLKTPLLVRDTVCNHEWLVTPSDILREGKNSGSICRVCIPKGPTRRKLPEVFAAELREIAPDLVLLGVYTTAVTKVRVQHKVCGHIWEVLPNTILNKAISSTCRICAPVGRSKGEIEVAEFTKAVITGDRKILEGKELDIVFPELKFAIEYHGEYWHSDLHKPNNYHLDKLNACKAIGYDLVQMWEHEWYDKQEIVKSRLLAKLGLLEPVGARKCELRETPFPSDFLEENHLQGKGTPTKINLGLFFKDELAAVMTFGTPRFNKNYDYELVRFCTITGINIQGGASKLFKYFKNNYKGSVISYSDKRWGTGKVYENLGFKYSHSSAPAYFYYNGHNKLSRYQCQKHKLEALFPDIFSIEKTEKEIMREAGYYRCYDCGNDVYTVNV